MKLNQHIYLCHVTETLRLIILTCSEHILSAIQGIHHVLESVKVLFGNTCVIHHAKPSNLVMLVIIMPFAKLFLAKAL